MQFRSISRRGLSAIASGAVVAGALTVPVLMAAPAQAATTIPDVAFTCAFGSNTFSYTSDVDLSAEWDKTSGRAELTAELEPMTNPAPPFVNLPNQTHSATVSVNVDGSATATSLTGSSVANFQGGTPMVIPATSGLASAKAESLSVAFGSLAMTVGSSSFTCAPTAPVAAVTVPITFPSGSDLNFVCSFGANKFAYMTDATVTAAQKGANAEVSVELEHMPNTAPVFISLPDQNQTGELQVSVGGGSPVTATGSHVADFQGGTAVDIPTLKASVPSTGSSVALTVGGFLMKVEAIEIPCALASPVTLAAAAVTPETPVVTPPVVTPPVVTPPVVQPPAVVKSDAKTKVTAKYSKKSKTATISVKISGGSAKASGKVKVEVKKGKKTVKKMSVKLKKGSATAKVKKLKKGKYKVTVTYAGDDNYNGSTGKAGLKV